MKLEAELKWSFDLIDQVIELKIMTKNQAMDEFALLSIRAICHISKKSKLTWEAVEYNNISEIFDTFFKAIGRKPKAETKPPISSQAKPSETTGSQFVSLQQLSDPAFICSQKGFKASTVVYERSVGPQNLFDIKAFGECIQLEQRSTLLVKPVKASIPLETFLKEFVPFKGDLPMIIENSIVAAH